MSAMSRLANPLSRLPCNFSLYLVANRPSFEDENLFFSKIEQAVKGGVSCVQLRDLKHDYRTCLKTARHLKEMLPSIPLFINTFEPIKLAEAIGADGVYLEKGIGHSEARKILGEKMIIGVPVKTMDQVNALNDTHEIDYLSVKLFPSRKTCPINDVVWGIEGLRKIRSASPHRIVAIGGLTVNYVENIYKELQLNDGIAMAGGLMAEDDPYLTAQKIDILAKKVRGQK